MKKPKNESNQISGGSDYSLMSPNNVKSENDYNLVPDANELFNEQIETKIVNGKRYFNVKKQKETNT